jgi:mono/diheme cytochrome c family protein
MKNNQNKTRVIILIISLITILSLSDCGQNDKDKKTGTVTEPVKNEVAAPIVTNESKDSVPVSPVNIDKPANKQPDVKIDPKKETVPAVNTKVKEPDKKTTVVQPVVINNKPVNNTIVSPTNEKPVVKPVEPTVVKVTEPVKPKTDTVAKPVVVTKPVVVNNPQPEQNTWVVPAKYKTMTSPYATDKDAFEQGKTLFGTHCKSCHGSKGDGNGPKAAQIDTKIGSFLSAEFLAQKPGEVFYKTTFGRKDMPKFENKISDEEDRWAVVYYIMHLKN